MMQNNTNIDSLVSKLIEALEERADALSNSINIQYRYHLNSNIASGLFDPDDTRNQEISQEKRLCNQYSLNKENIHHQEQLLEQCAKYNALYWEHMRSKYGPRYIVLAIIGVLSFYLSGQFAHPDAEKLFFLISAILLLSCWLPNVDWTSNRLNDELKIIYASRNLMLMMERNPSTPSLLRASRNYFFPLHDARVSPTNSLTPPYTNRVQTV